MKTDWDYSALANAYMLRPDYSEAAIDSMLAIAGVGGGNKVCDVGAGVAHLSLMLAERGLSVSAVEPNPEMRSNGIAQTIAVPNISWSEGTGEATGQADDMFDIVTFGSSFNVCERSEALKETARILRPRGWFACMWNHRDLEDGIQQNIERIIGEKVPEYGYGTRREDQTSIVEQSGLFGPVIFIKSRVLHEQSVEDCIVAWRSHATLARQAGEKFEQVVDSIGAYLQGLGLSTITIPYSTNIWMARLV